MEDLELEKQNLEDLIGKSIAYQVKYRCSKPADGFGRFVGKRIIIDAVRDFEIKPPTLAVMDRLSRVSLDLEAISQNLAEAANGVDLVKGSISESARCMAEYVAIATLGADYYVTARTPEGKYVRREDKKALEELTEFLFTWLTAAELLTLAQLIISSMGLENFLNSMRLLKGTRTAAKKKNLIE
ncbi:hypothetical protein [Leadbetterella byssophila]|uniref:hypothetical protein n=1 Tax=Leadbetterella byssophila TaxID=316068 RepID=UPI0039A2362B